MGANKKTILVTGGFGYIGSNTVVSLADNGYRVIIVDDLSNSKLDVMDDIWELIGYAPAYRICDVRNYTELARIFKENEIHAVIHFAGKKAVGESLENPLLYYDVNIGGTLNLLRVMAEHNCFNFVFSSSAIVYGDLNEPPYHEKMIPQAKNPYGKTKLLIEQILEEMHQSNGNWNIICLRYFNPIGAHESGKLGEKPNGVPNNLMPYIVGVAKGHYPYVRVFGNDYATYDGTGIRDYIHVSDLAEGHVAALKRIMQDTGQFVTINLGSGKGYSVLELIHTFSRVHRMQIPYRIHDRRPGDVATSYANISLANSIVGWFPKRGLETMCSDAWKSEANLKR